MSCISVTCIIVIELVLYDFTDYSLKIGPYILLYKNISPDFES
jgi:hypothetical protein